VMVTAAFVVLCRVFVTKGTFTSQTITAHNPMHLCRVANHRAKLAGSQHFWRIASLETALLLHRTLVRFSLLLISALHCIQIQLHDSCMRPVRNFCDNKSCRKYSALVERRVSSEISVAPVAETKRFVRTKSIYCYSCFCFLSATGTVLCRLI
jgi:hypothetical protein